MEEYPVTCPYCGEEFTALLDWSAGSQQYIEDCEVCCRPINFSVHVGAAGELTGVETRRDDE